MITHSIPNKRVFKSNATALGYRFEYTFVPCKPMSVPIIRVWCDTDKYFPEVMGVYFEARGTGTLKTPNEYILLV